MGNYYRARALKDANHKEIVNYLEQHGVEVVDLSDAKIVPDILCFYRGFIGFIEIKVPTSGRGYKRAQLEFIADTKMPVCIATNKYEAMAFMEKGLGLSVAQKNAISFLLVRSGLKSFGKAPVEKALANAKNY